MSDRLPETDFPTLPANLTDELRGMYATALEYPEEVVTDEAEFEADLGVDSLRQRELLVQALEHYGLHNQELRTTEYPNLAAVAELLRTLASARES